MVLGTVGSAAATDLLGVIVPGDDASVRPVSWTGFIISPSVGYETLKFHGSGSPALRTARGWAYGGELGYDWQASGLVYGVVVNALAADIKGGGTRGERFSDNSHLEGYGLLRSRLGLPMDRLLIFGTAGIAAGQLKVGNQTLGLSERQTLIGWTAGAGLEFVYNRRITLRAEYIHVDLAERNFSSLRRGGDEVGATMELFKFGIVTRY